MAIGAIYAATVMTSSLLIRKPAPGYIPAGWTPPVSATGGAEQNVNTNMAMKTPQVRIIFDHGSMLIMKYFSFLNKDVTLIKYNILHFSSGYFFQRQHY